MHLTTNHSKWSS